MYKIPCDFNVNSWIGKNVQQVCFALNNVVISFSKDAYIRIEFGFSIQRGDCAVFKKIEPVTNGFDLLVLLEKKIMDIQIEDDNCTLVLVFEGELLIRLFSQPGYESFILKNGDNEIIV